MKGSFNSEEALRLFDNVKALIINQITLILLENPSLVLEDSETFELENTGYEVREITLTDGHPFVHGADEFDRDEDYEKSIHTLDLRDSINILAILEDKFGS